MRMVVNCAAYQGGRRVADIDIEHDAAAALDLVPSGDAAQTSCGTAMAVRSACQAANGS